MKTKGHRSGPLPADLYADLVTFHKSGHLSPTLSPTLGLDMGIRFRVIADIGEKVRLEPGTNTLICKNTGQPMVAKERFEAAVMAVHTRDGLDGPGHRGILSTINQVRNQYSIGESNFGIPEAEIKRIVLRCPDPNCTHRLWKAKFATGHWNSTKPIIFKKDSKYSSQQNVTNESEQLQPLDLSIKPASSGAPTGNSTKPLKQHAIRVKSAFHTLAPGRGWAPTVRRPIKRDLSENPLRDIQASWTSAIHLVNNAPLRLESPPSTAGTSQEGLGTSSPCTSPKKSTDNPPPPKRQKVSGTKILWPSLVPDRYKMFTVAWRPKNSAGKESGSKLGSLPPLTGVYMVKSASPVANSSCAITSTAPSHRLLTKYRPIAAKGPVCLAGPKAAASKPAPAAQTTKEPSRLPSSITVELVTTADKPGRPIKKWIHTFKPFPAATPEKGLSEPQEGTGPDVCPEALTSPDSPSPLPDGSTCSSPIDVVDVSPMDISLPEEPTPMEEHVTEAFSPAAPPTQPTGGSDSEFSSPLISSRLGSPDPSIQLNHIDPLTDTDGQSELDSPARDELLALQDEPIVITSGSDSDGHFSDKSDSPVKCGLDVTQKRQREFVDLNDLLNSMKGFGKTLGKTITAKENDECTAVGTDEIGVSQVDTHPTRDTSSMLMHLLHLTDKSPTKVCYAQFCLADLLSIIQSMRRDIPRALIQDENGTKQLQSKIQKGLDIIADAKNIIAA